MQSSKQPSIRGPIVTTYSGEHREVKLLIQGHTVSRWQSQYLNPGCNHSELKMLAQQTHKWLFLGSSSTWQLPAH